MENLLTPEVLDGLIPLTLGYKEPEKEKRYSLFNALGLDSHRECYHSQIIGSLLDRYAHHNHGTKLLELFRKHVLVHENLQGVNFDFSDAHSEVEKNFGAVTYDTYPTGGRVDIWVNSSPVILIENKINAADQESQLERYYNTEKAKKVILYLTLDGHQPSDYSSNDLVEGKDFYCISYNEHIMAWLKACVDELQKVDPLCDKVDTHLTVAIQTYLDFLNTLLNPVKAMTEKQFQQLTDYFTQSENKYSHNEVLRLRDQLNSYHQEWARKVGEAVKQKIAEAGFGSNVQWSSILGEDSNNVIAIRPPKWENCFITLGFDGRGYKHYQAGNPYNDFWFAFEAKDNAKASAMYTDPVFLKHFGSADREGHWLFYDYFYPSEGQAAMTSTLEIDVIATIMSSKVIELIKLFEPVENHPWL